MKRLALLALTAVMALTLSACGESVEKKDTDTTTTQTQGTDTTNTTPAPEGTNTPAQ